MDEHSIKPLGDRVLIKRDKNPTEKGGIILIDSTKEKLNRGKVISLGTTEDVSMLQKGDNVLFTPYAAVEVLDDEHLIVSKDDVLCVIE